MHVLGSIGLSLFVQCSARCVCEVACLYFRYHMFQYTSKTT